LMPHGSHIPIVPPQASFASRQFALDWQAVGVEARLTR
jgi:hypothetical protein